MRTKPAGNMPDASTASVTPTTTPAMAGMAARHTASSASWRSVNPSVSSGWRSTGASRTWRESSWPSATTAASPATRAISHVPRACASTAVRISLPMTLAASTCI